ncbi:MAG: DUF3362 domain-containing protein, partial [Oscillospiraceae bacterium]|nr:DUF3362 domain-containing protein [Oscillospiraceae bacterium]
ALKKAGRTDLIGYGKNCLVRPERPRGEADHTKNAKPARNAPVTKSGGRRTGSGQGQKKAGKRR